MEGMLNLLLFATFWTLLAAFGRFLDAFWTLFRRFLDAFWTLFGRFLDAF